MHRTFGNLATSFCSIARKIRSASMPRLALAVAGIVLAIAVRLPLLDFKSLDFYQDRIQSFPLIQTQGFAALANTGSAYNPTYFYFLYMIAWLFPGLPMTAAVKLPAMIMDFVCALFVYLIVRLKYEKSWAPLGAAFAVLFAPTVIANGA